MNESLDTVRDIITIYLKLNGYDGLCGDECGCGLDDLVACDAACDQCIPAYHWTCCPCEEADCEYGCEAAEFKVGCYRTEVQP